MSRWCRWFGHNFQGRYDRTPLNFEMKGISPSDIIFFGDRIERVIDKFVNVTYVKDVCTGCGLTIDRSAPASGRTEGPADG
jgi:hypothetical protein